MKQVDVLFIGRDFAMIQDIVMSWTEPNLPMKILSGNRHSDWLLSKKGKTKKMAMFEAHK